MAKAEPDRTRAGDEDAGGSGRGRVDGYFRFLPEAIEIYRSGRGFSRELLVVRSALEMEAIAAFENAERAPTLKELQQLLTGLGVNLTELSILLSILRDSVRAVDAGISRRGAAVDVVKILATLETHGVLGGGGRVRRGKGRG
jgi:transcriptional regulator with XRE-family HTH domain